MNKRTTAFLILVVALLSEPAIAQDDCDCHPRLVDIGGGVELEVLDWGGEGQPMVLLAGMGNTAHVYAGFAHQFTDQYHVMGITRRGFGASSAAEDGYDTPTLAADILAVLDHCEHEAVVLVGHSIAGEEMTAFAVAHPQRVAALVYLDAAQDRTDMAARQAEIEWPRPLAFTPADGASMERLNAYLARARGWRVPPCELQALYGTDESGAVAGFNGHPTAAAQIVEGLVPSVFEDLEVPALAIFIGPTMQGMFPGYRGYDDPDLEKAKRCVDIFSERVAVDMERFRTQAGQGEVAVLLGANHHLFLTHEGDVVREMERFLAAVDTIGN